MNHRTFLLLGAAAIGAVALPWVANAYLVSIGSIALVTAMLALSAQLVSGLAGQAPLGQAAYLGVGAYTAAAVAPTAAGYGIVQLTAAAAAGAAAAAVTGALAVRARGVTFLMITFAVGELMHVAAVTATAVTGGSEGVHVSPTPPLPGMAALAGDGQVYLYILAVFASNAVAVSVLTRSRLALRLRAAADCEPRMRASGHATTADLWIAYTAAGALAGAAGALLATANQHVSPADMAFPVSVIALAAAVIGVGTMPGACAAAIVLVVVRDWLGGLAGHGVAVVGLLLIAAAYLPRHRLLTAGRTP